MTGTDRFDLSGRTAIVTGAAGLLGREFADALAERGAAVVLVDIDSERLAPVVEAIAGQRRGSARALVLDITSETEVRREVAALGRVDVLVNSAAIDPKVAPGEVLDGHLSSYPLAQWEASLRVNLTGTFLMTQACVRTMERQGERGEGVIVSLGSTYGLAGPDQRIYEAPGSPPSFKPVDYAVTKAGIIGFTRAVAAMYRGTGIRANVLTPGGTFAGQDDGFVARYSSRTILDRMATPQDYREAIAFLCSDASSYMTGANLVVDGGWTAW